MNRQEQHAHTARLAVAAFVLAVLPLLWPTIPPLTDVPGHIGRYHLMLGRGSASIAQWYSFEWHLVPNLGADLIVSMVAPGIGLIHAVKLVALAIPPLTLAACVCLSRVVHGQVSPTAFLAVPFAYNQAFQIGFLNYTLAMAGAIAAIALWLRLGAPRHTWLRACLMLAISVIIWVIHAFGWAALVLAVAAAELRKHLKEGRSPVRAAIGAVIACLPLAPPLILTIFWRSGSAGTTEGFFDLDTKLLAFAAMLRDRWAVWDLIGVGVLGAGVYVAYRRKWITGSHLLLWSAGSWVVGFLLLPKWLFGSGLADVRLAPYAALLALVALRPVHSRERLITMAVGIFVTARIAGLTISLGLYGQSVDAELRALDYLPRGVRLVSLVSPGCAGEWGSERLDHLGSIALAYRDVFTNDQWVLPGAQLVSIRPPVGAAPFTADPSQFLHCEKGQVIQALRRVPRAAFDYVWVIKADERPPATMPGFRRLWSADSSALYLIEGGVTPRSGGPVPLGSWVHRRSGAMPSRSS